MAALSDEIDTLKFVHTYGAGLHSGDADPDVHDPRWQRRQVDDFVEFAVLAEELGFDGITVTEHHAPLMTCPSPHLLLAAAAVKTSRIRLGTAVTVLPLYSPLRVAEEAGTLDLLSGGRFELGLGRGIPGEAQIAAGRNLSDNDLKRAWLEGLEVVNMALTERDFTFDGGVLPGGTPHHDRDAPAPGPAARVAGRVEQTDDAARGRPRLERDAQLRKQPGAPGRAG